MTKSQQDEKKYRIFSNSSLTSKLITKEIPFSSLPIQKILPNSTVEKKSLVLSPINAENEMPNKEEEEKEDEEEGEKLN